jgi:DNA-directed RNA polymerase subunit RPC12/RpoP
MEIKLRTFAYKACPRCSGDLALDHESSPAEYICIQCGRRQDVSTVLALQKQTRELLTSTPGGTLAA